MIAPFSEFQKPNSIVESAGATGLEPAASCVTGRRSNQLNYAPANLRLVTSLLYVSFFDPYDLYGLVTALRF